MLLLRVPVHAEESRQGRIPTVSHVGATVNIRDSKATLGMDRVFPWPQQWIPELGAPSLEFMLALGRL